MKEITKLMIDEYNLKKLGYDFMGFTFKRTSELSFHHLIIPHKDCKNLQIECDGYVRWNGAILVQDTSHEYLHVIEHYDRDRFDFITDRMIEMNANGELDNQRLKQIGMVLTGFENDFKSYRTNKGRRLIKIQYHNRLF